MNAVVVVILILIFIFVVMPLLAFMFTVTVVSGTVRSVGKDITKSVKDHKETESKKKFPLSLAGYKSRQGKLPAPGIPARRVGSGGTRYRDYSCTNDQECAAIAFSKDGYSTHGYNKAQACKILEEGNLIDAPKPMEEGTLFKDTLNCAPFDAEEVPRFSITDEDRQLAGEMGRRGKREMPSAEALRHGGNRGMHTIPAAVENTAAMRAAAGKGTKCDPNSSKGCSIKMGDSDMFNYTDMMIK